MSEAQKGLWRVNLGTRQQNVQSLVHAIKLLLGLLTTFAAGNVMVQTLCVCTWQFCIAQQTHKIHTVATADVAVLGHVG